MAKPVKRTGNQAPGRVPNSDGAVRELEKAGIAAQTEHESRAHGGPSQQTTEVVPIGKAGNGAPEETRANTEEHPTTQSDGGQYGA